MQKVAAKELMKLVKLCIVGLLLVIIVVLSGEQLQGIEALVMGIIPYILYQLYCVIRWVMHRTKK